MVKIKPRQSFTVTLFLVIFTFVIGVFIAYFIFERQLRETSLKQSEVIANILNYASETLYRADDLQRLVGTLSGESNVEFILLFGSAPPQTMASSYRRWIGAPLQELPLEPDLIQDIQEALAHRRPIFRLDKQAMLVDYLSPILLTQAIVRGQGTGLTPAVTVIRLDLRVIHERAFGTSITAATLIIGAVFSTGIILFQLHRRRVDKIVRTIISSINQFRNEDNIAVPEDIQLPEVKDLATELIRTFVALNRSEQRLRFSLEAGDIWAFEVELTQGIIAWREDRGLLFNDDTSNNSPKTLGDIYWAIHPEDRSSVKAQLSNSIENDEPFNSEFRIQVIDGSYHWVAGKGKFTMRQGNRSMILTGIDITQRKQFETTITLQQAKLIASSKMSALGEMAAGIAHEINNPIAIIDGKARQIRIFLSRDPVPKDAIVSAMESIFCMIKRISKIIRGLRNFSRNSDADPFETVKLKTILDETLSLCKERFRANNIQLIIEDIPLDLELECRANEISQVLLNLLSNAFDAVVNFREKWVKVSCMRTDNMVEISVTDSGRGIPESIRSKLTQPFFTTKEVGRGTGLGLSISKGIIEAHCGSLRYDEESPNTRFVVHMPISQPNLNTAIENDQ